MSSAWKKFKYVRVHSNSINSNKNKIFIIPTRKVLQFYCVLVLWVEQTVSTLSKSFLSWLLHSVGLSWITNLGEVTFSLKITNYFELFIHTAEHIFDPEVHPFYFCVWYHVRQSLIPRYTHFIYSHRHHHYSYELQNIFEAIGKWSRNWHSYKMVFWEI